MVTRLEFFLRMEEKKDQTVMFNGCKTVLFVNTNGIHTTSERPFCSKRALIKTHQFRIYIQFHRMLTHELDTWHVLIGFPHIRR